MTIEGEFDLGGIVCFGSDELCKNQKCVISRVGGDGLKYYPCICDMGTPAEGSGGELGSSVEIPDKEFTTEELVDKLIEKGYRVTLSRP